jgi:hypothetical protein
MNGVSGTTSFAFNGTAATFTVKSSTEVTTTVPSGAATCYVRVTTRHADQQREIQSAIVELPRGGAYRARRQSVKNLISVEWEVVC